MKNIKSLSLLGLTLIVGLGLIGSLSIGAPAAGNSLPEEAPPAAPDFTLTSLDGERYTLSKLRGKVVLVNFWATWCPPCLKEIPYFVELQEEYGEQGFQIIGIAIDDEDAVRAFADDMGINYPVMASELEAIELSKHYGNRIGALPYSVVINRNGEITDTIMGDLDKIRVEEILEKLGLRI
jgi:peroxiredoxin